MTEPMKPEVVAASNALIAEMEKGDGVVARIETPVTAQTPPNKIAIGATPPQKIASNLPLARPATTPTKPVTTVAALAKNALGAAPKGIKDGNTADLDSSFLHAVLFSEYDGRKTTTAATFDDPEWVRIIGTRNEEQLTPVRKRGYTYAIAHDEAELVWLLENAEKKWPEWAGRPDPDKRRTLVLDDGTEGVQMLIEGNEIINGQVVKDARRTYRAAGTTLRDVLIRKTLRDPQNFIMTALARSDESPVTPSEQIYAPDLPPAMLKMVMVGFEMVLYIDKAKWKFRTRDYKETFQVEREIDNKKQIVPLRRTVCCKIKPALEDAAEIKDLEDMTLQKLWCRVSGKRAPK